MELGPYAQMALDVIRGEHVDGIAIWQINPMEWRMIDRLAGTPEGTYRDDPVPTYLKMLENSGVCALDQWIPTNPLSMGERGFESDTARGATTGAEEVVCDGMVIDSPEAVAEHIERFALPAAQRSVEAFDEDATVQSIIETERNIQNEFGTSILKAPYNYPFPALYYTWYGYANYFMAYALYPELMERLFSAQADYAVVHNMAAARAYKEGNLPPYARLDHDMADAKGTLVDVASLDRIWFPHFARSIEPLAKAGVRMLWHCDGNLMEMVPRLIECGVSGFQGFEYEHGMDYEKICGMKTREGAPLLIVAGVSVTTTLPYGTPDDVRKQMAWLVEHGPEDHLMLACTSSITPGVPWENLEALRDGFLFYRDGGSQAQIKRTTMQEEESCTS